MKTVFVIGAGASKEVNLPMGSELKNRIADSLHPASKGGEDHIWDAFQYATTLSYSEPFTWEQLHTASAHIQRAMPQSISIDHFLNVHSDNRAIVFCGKLAITHSILKAEAESLLNVKNSPNSMLQFKGAAETTWFNGFMQLLTEDCHKTNLKRRLSSIALIIFNYDRCVEHYIYHYLRSYYDIDEAEAADVVKGIEIYHPYGSVGSLPYLDGEHPIQFGEMPHARTLPILASQIRTFTEGTNEKSSDIVAIRRHMQTALRLVFLGFAFHSRNMDLLQPKQHLKDRKVFATCHMLPHNKIDKISLGFGSNGPLGDDGLHFDGIKCSRLFNNYLHDFPFNPISNRTVEGSTASLLPPTPLRKTDGF